LLKKRRKGLLNPFSGGKKRDELHHLESKPYLAKGRILENGNQCLKKGKTKLKKERRSRRPSPDIIGGPYPKGKKTGSRSSSSGGRGAAWLERGKDYLSVDKRWACWEKLTASIADGKKEGCLLRKKEGEDDTQTKRLRLEKSSHLGEGRCVPGGQEENPLLTKPSEFAKEKKGLRRSMGGEVEARDLMSLAGERQNYISETELTVLPEKKGSPLSAPKKAAPWEEKGLLSTKEGKKG